MEPTWIESASAWISAHPLAAGAVVFLIAFCDALVIVGMVVPALPLLFAVGAMIGLGHVNGPYALLAAFVTGLTMAVLLLGVKALFFFADNGYRDPGLGGPIACAGGADCVYQRYLDEGRGPALEEIGVTDAESFAAFYWQQQTQSAGLILVLTTVGGAGGALIYGVTRPRRSSPATA